MIIVSIHNTIFLILLALFIPMIESAPDPLNDLTVNINIGASTPKNGTLPTLSFERRWKTIKGSWTVSMQVSENTVYVLKGFDYGNEIVSYDLEGNFVKKYPGWFILPWDVALVGNPSSPQLLVSAISVPDNPSPDWESGMVLYNKSGDYFHGFHEKHTGLKFPKGLVTSPSGEQVIVADGSANRTVIMDVGWIDATISASDEPGISVPYPYRVAISVEPGSMSSSAIHRYIISSTVCCGPWTEVSSDPSGNILLVDEGAKKTHFLDNDGNYIGVIEELGAPLKIVFHKNKVYTITREKEHNDDLAYVNVFAYSN